MKRPDTTEYAPYYERYVSLVTGDVANVLGSQTTRLQDMITAMPEEKGEFRYAEGKWSIKELLGHLIDGERMFSYRVLRISRGDETPIEGFEQDGYIENAHSNQRSFAEILEEFSLLRRANMILFKNLTDEDWSRLGTASGATVSVRALDLHAVAQVQHAFLDLAQFVAVHVPEQDRLTDP